MALNKGGLQKERGFLKLYQKLLPSLDLKRRQLTLIRQRAAIDLAAAEAEVSKLVERTAEQVPMLANRGVEIKGLVRVGSLRVEEENVVGVRLPVLREVTCSAREYSLLAKPPWVDAVVLNLARMVEEEARLKVARERVRILDAAVRRITQRVNLFDKILIPTARRNIQRILIFLGDGDRAAVVRSKIAKFRHQRPEMAPAEESA